MNESTPPREIRGLLIFLRALVCVPVGVAVVLGVAAGDPVTTGIGVLFIIPAVEAWEACKSTEWGRRAPAIGNEGLVGRTAEVIHDCSPRGTVKINGELWRAVSKSGGPIAAGRRVVVLDVQGLTLTVEPEDMPRGAGDA